MIARQLSVRVVDVVDGEVTVRLRLLGSVHDVYLRHGEEKAVPTIRVAGPRRWTIAGYSNRVEIDDGPDVAQGEKIPVVELPDA